MKLEDLEHVTLKAYNVEPNKLNNFHFNSLKLNSMITPRISEFGEVFNRASNGLSAEKTVKGDLVCFRKIGKRHGGTNTYADQTTAFDMLDLSYLSMIDDDATGRQCFLDFLQLKSELIKKFKAEFMPFKAQILAKYDMEMNMLKPTKLKNGLHLFHEHTSQFKIADRYHSLVMVRREHIENPLSLHIILDGSWQSLDIHPRRKKLKDGNKTMASHSGRKYHYSYRYRRDNKGIVSYDFFGDPCVDEFDMTDDVNQIIDKYNDLINWFNCELDILKKKYLALYTLNSIGLKSCNL